MAQLVSIMAPYGRDASVIKGVLDGAATDNLIHRNVEELLAAVSDGRSGAIVISEEALSERAVQTLCGWLSMQPPWSDLPIVLLTRRSSSSAQQSALAAALGNVTILERPFSSITLISAVRAALRARSRQREAERHILQLAARERELDEERRRLQNSQHRLREANEKLGQRFAEALAEKRILADIVEGTDAFVQVADLKYRWLAINRSSANEFQRIYGMRPQVGQSMLDVLEHMPEHRKAVQAVWGRALAGEEFTEIGEFGDPGHDRRFYEMKYNSLRDENGELIGAYQFVYDVTDRIRDQQTLAEAQARMHEMAKLETLGQLTGGVAHDFNNLLTPIVGALDLLHHRFQKDERAVRYITAALEASHRASTLVHRLLSFARRQHLETRVINVGELVEGIRDLVQRSIGSHIKVSVTTESDLAPTRIDPNQLELAILNLAVNAADAMPTGGALSIAVAQRTVSDNEIAALRSGTYICLSVADSGVGMDEATMKRSVEPFFTTKGVGRGTGLGLSMVHGLAAQSGGALNLKSVLGQGTTAEIWLPVSSGEAEPLASSEAPQSKRLSRTTVLIVDDEELVRRATVDMLRELGHQVFEAPSGTAALEILRQRDDVQVLITDHVMPGISGSELVQKARNLRPELKALLITGYAKLTDDATDVARLAKPFRATDLSRELQVLLEGGEVLKLEPRPRRNESR
jgi:PAS domain S-box-containing protein